MVPSFTSRSQAFVRKSENLGPPMTLKSAEDRWSFHPVMSGTFASQRSRHVPQYWLDGTLESRTVSSGSVSWRLGTGLKRVTLPTEESLSNLSKSPLASGKEDGRMQTSSSKTTPEVSMEKNQEIASTAPSRRPRFDKWLFIFTGHDHAVSRTRSWTSETKRLSD